MIDLNLSRNLAVGPRAGCSHVLFLLPVLMAGLGLNLADRVRAQTFTTLHNFNFADSDGINPYAGLILSSNTLFGTTAGGGSSGWGTVFKVNTDGTGLIVLHAFGDQEKPYAGLILSSNTLFGTTAGGGS